MHLKSRKRLSRVLKIIETAIPYTIIFTIFHEKDVLITVSKKHPHPVNPDNSVIDWTFTSEWLPLNEFPYRLSLAGSLDDVVNDLCRQISSISQPMDIDTLVRHQAKRNELLKSIKRVETALRKAKQINRKVELNQELQNLKGMLHSFGNSDGLDNYPPDK